MLHMVLEALKAREARQGTSVVAIKVYIQHKYPTVDTTRFKYLLKQALETGVRRGLLTRPAHSKAKGATGSFKVSYGEGGGGLRPLVHAASRHSPHLPPQPSADPYCALWGARTVSGSVYVASCRCPPHSHRPTASGGGALGQSLLASCGTCGYWGAHLKKSQSWGALLGPRGHYWDLVGVCVCVCGASGSIEPQITSLREAGKSVLSPLSLYSWRY